MTEAITAYGQALVLCQNVIERRFLQRRRSELLTAATVEVLKVLRVLDAVRSHLIVWSRLSSSSCPVYVPPIP